MASITTNGKTFPLVIASGSKGYSAYRVAVNNGFVGTEAEWLESLNGTDGVSAYEVAVQNGFEGTESEWLASLNGDDGLNGWTPVLAGEADGERRVLKVSDWTGGEGTKPATGVYVGADGLTSEISEAIDIRGASGEKVRDWDYIEIDNTLNSATLTDYQVPVTITYNPLMNADFSDIRFYDAYGMLKLDYFILHKTDGVSARVFVKVPTVFPSTKMRILIKFGGGVLVQSESNGPATFPVGFEDFVNNSHHQIPFGSDGGWCSGFAPTRRRFYFFGTASDSLVNFRTIPWVDIDTWETGYVMSNITFSINSASVVYHEAKEKFYIYGGSGGGLSALVKTVYSFDPATETLALLPEQLLVNTFNPEACVDKVSGKVFLFGGRTAVGVGVNEMTDTISVHDIDAGTITDTGANLWAASDGMTPTFADHDGYIYTFGGTYNTGGPGTTLSTNKIFKYNPSTPSVNPVDTGIVLALPTDTPGVAYRDAVFYVFGGYSYVTSTYSNLIQKFSVVDNAIETLEPTLPHADDDMKAFFDPVKDRIFFGPVLHSTAASNSDNGKVMVLEFDPNLDFLYPETPFGGLASGWVNLSTGTTPPRVVGGSGCTWVDYASTSFIGMKKAFTTLSPTGIYRLDVDIILGGSAAVETYNMQIYVGSSALVVANLSTEAIMLLRSDSVNWLVDSPGTIIAAAGNGYKTVSGIMNFNTSKINGLVNDANKTADITFKSPHAGKTINTVYVGTGSATVGGIVLGGLRFRTGTSGVEPTATVLN